MSAGPATKMHDYVKRWADRGFVEARERIEDLPPATLEAMDAAAAVMSRESGRVKVDGAITSRAPAAIVDVGGQLLWLEPHDEQALLAVLLRREVQRRKEEAQHA